MSWQNYLKGDALSWVLEESEPSARYQSLKHLLNVRGDDPNLIAAQNAAIASAPVAAILDHMALKVTGKRLAGGTAPSITRESGRFLLSLNWDYPYRMTRALKQPADIISNMPSPK
jgi:hypothetical protein